MSGRLIMEGFLVLILEMLVLRLRFWKEFFIVILVVNVIFVVKLSGWVNLI